MLWGNGDSSKLTDAERKTLADLRRLVETGHLVGLTPEQTQVVLSAVKFYASISATSGLLVGAKNVAIWVGGMIMMWWAFRDTVVELIKKAASG